VDDPGSQPYVVSVGGLTLESLTPTEKVWNDKSDGDGDGAGRGGISTKWLRPTWQTGVGVITKHSSNAPCGASTNSYCREVPDVSADADPDTGGWVFYFEGERLGGEGGTSAASPLWAALTAVINSQCTSGTVGFDAPTLYWAASTAGNFTDVTAGNNDYTGTHDGLYPANAGFDMASGLGSPLASGLAKSLCVPPPSVSKISPNEGAPAGGTVVTITGSNLARAIAVDFGSTPATSYTVKSATQITATSPALSAGTDNVTVTTAGGTSATGSADDFTYTTAPPVVSALSPKEGPTTGGTSVTITGSDFGGTTKVLFGTLSATSFTVKSATQIIAVSPAQAAATVNVSVTTPNGTSSAVSADDFTYT